MHFNSRPHEEVDRGASQPLQVPENFNSRPHEEVDYTQVVTSFGILRISTHDLTRRSTSSVHSSPVSLSFQLTTSRRGRLSNSYSLLQTNYFNSRPHEEVDGCLCILNGHVYVFQLTTSRRGRRYPIRLILCLVAFQLTTSRRGRHRDIRIVNHN